MKAPREDEETAGGASRRRPIAWVAILAFFALVAAGCGGDSTSESSSADANADDAGAVEDESTDDSAADDGAADDDPAADDPAADEPEPRYVEGDADVIFAQDRVNTFELTLAPESLAFLDADPKAEEYVEGALTFDGETIEGVGIRYKGSVGSWFGCTAESGAKSCTKLSTKVKINQTDGDAEFYGQRRLNFHALNNDRTLMHDRLGYWLYREMGVPAPRLAHVRLVVNGQFMGVYALTENVDGRFTRANFDDGKGNLYKEVWPTDDSGAPVGDEALFAGLETNEDEDPSFDLITTFAEQVGAAGPADAGAVLERWTDIEDLLAHTVVDRAIRHDDGPFIWKCALDEPCAPHNYYWYGDPTAQKVHLVPWDLDFAFYKIGVDAGDYWGNTTGCDPQRFEGPEERPVVCDPIVAAIAGFDADLERVRSELVSGPLSVEQADAQLDAWSAQIADAVAEADAAYDDAPSVADWNTALADLRSDLDVARAG